MVFHSCEDWVREPGAESRILCPAAARHTHRRTIVATIGVWRYRTIRMRGDRVPRLRFLQAWNPRCLSRLPKIKHNAELPRIRQPRAAVPKQAASLLDGRERTRSIHRHSLRVTGLPPLRVDSERESIRPGALRCVLSAGKRGGGDGAHSSAVHETLFRQGERGLRVQIRPNLCAGDNFVAAGAHGDAHQESHIFRAGCEGERSRQMARISGWAREPRNRPPRVRSTIPPVVSTPLAGELGFGGEEAKLRDHGNRGEAHGQAGSRECGAEDEDHATVPGGQPPG